MSQANHDFDQNSPETQKKVNSEGQVSVAD
jgi:hypothetical protein